MTSLVVAVCLVGAAAAPPARPLAVPQPSPCARDAVVRGIASDARRTLDRIARARSRADRLAAELDELRGHMWAQSAPVQSERARLKELSSRLTRVRSLESRLGAARAAVGALERELDAIRERGRRARVPPACMR